MLQGLSQSQFRGPFSQRLSMSQSTSPPWVHVTDDDLCSHPNLSYTVKLVTSYRVVLPPQASGRVGTCVFLSRNQFSVVLSPRHAWRQLIAYAGALQGGDTPEPVEVLICNPRDESMTILPGTHIANLFVSPICDQINDC